MTLSLGRVAGLTSALDQSSGPGAMTSTQRPTWAGAHRLTTHWELSEVNTVESRYLEFDGTIFNKFKLPEVQIYPTPNHGWRKQYKCIFDSDRSLEFRRIRDIRVRDIEIRLYLGMFTEFKTLSGAS